MNYEFKAFEVNVSKAFFVSIIQQIAKNCNLINYTQNS